MENHKFECQKVDYLFQVLAIGKACELLAHLTDTTPDVWLHQIRMKVDEQIKNMPIEEREKIIIEYTTIVASLEKVPSKDRASVIEIRVGNG